MDLAVIGAGPAGLALALLAARQLPRARVTLLDARLACDEIGSDPRTLALSLGSVQLLERLGAWPRERAACIGEVRVSQAASALPASAGEVRLTARDAGASALGAVIAYGALVQSLQARWNESLRDEPERLASRWGAVVQAVDADGPAGVRLRWRQGAAGTPRDVLVPPASGEAGHAGAAEAHGHFDLAVVAEGGVFASQARKALAHDYRQTAWVGTVVLEDAPEGVAFEHFTAQGPLALLPLPAAADARTRAALVWCVATDDDPVRELDDLQRLAVLASRWPRGAGRPVALSPLKSFALGLNAEASLVGGRWGSTAPGRMVRIGNAAQTLHPVAGQGLNLGLRDAFALVQALRRHDDIDEALRRVEWSRAPDRWSMIAITDFLARSFTWRWPGVTAARSLALALLESTPALKRQLARQMMFGRR